MPYTNEEARDLGAHRGYAAADYAANVSGRPVRNATREEQPSMSDKAWDYFTDGWDAGVEEFGRDDSAGESDDEIAAAQQADHIAQPAEGATVYDRDGFTAAEHARMTYPLVTTCTCGETLELPGPANHWSHRAA